ncbi:MAG: hypothetical protein WC837_00640 [Bellilinea sp.]
MYSLFFADEKQQDPLYLQGIGVVPPVRGAARQPRPDQLAGGLVEEVLTLECKNGDIRGLVTWLEQHLAQARAGNPPLHLWIQADQGTAPVGAQVQRWNYSAAERWTVCTATRACACVWPEPIG